MQMIDAQVMSACKLTANDDEVNLASLYRDVRADFFLSCAGCHPHVSVSLVRLHGIMCVLVVV